MVTFGAARFYGGIVNLASADFAGGAVDFRSSYAWKVPPELPPWCTPPAGVLLRPDTTTGPG